MKSAILSQFFCDYDRNDEDAYKIALIHLLINDVIIINDHWWHRDWDEQQRQTISINVICNDVFFTASDAEECKFNELLDLYEYYLRDEHYGPIVWISKKRKLKPKESILKNINPGLWNS